LQLPNVAAGGGPPDGTAELFVEQHTVSDGQAASHVKDGSRNLNL
jgi:hypothetical protein